MTCTETRFRLSWNGEPQYHGGCDSSVNYWELRCVCVFQLVVFGPCRIGYVTQSWCVL